MSPLLSTPHSKWASIRISCKVGNYYTTRSWRTGNLWQTYFVMVNQVIMVTLRPRNYDLSLTTRNPWISSFFAINKPLITEIHMQVQHINEISQYKIVVISFVFNWPPLSVTTCRCMCLFVSSLNQCVWCVIFLYKCSF